MKRFWRTCSKRLVKKYFPRFYQDGCCINYDAWDARMKMLQNLQAGDPIYLPSINEWGKIKEIQFYWKPIEKEKFKFYGSGFDSIEESKYVGPKHHKFVFEFSITATSNNGKTFFVYDFDHFLIKGVRFDDNWLAFNKAAGLIHDALYLPKKMSEVTQRSS